MQVTVLINTKTCLSEKLYWIRFINIITYLSIVPTGTIFVILFFLTYKLMTCNCNSVLNRSDTTSKETTNDLTTIRNITCSD